MVHPSGYVSNLIMPSIVVISPYEIEIFHASFPRLCDEDLPTTHSPRRLLSLLRMQLCQIIPTNSPKSTKGNLLTECLGYWS